MVAHACSHNKAPCLRRCQACFVKPVEPPPPQSAPQFTEWALSTVQEIVKPQRQAPSTDQLVSGAVAVLKKVPVAAFSLADLLLSHCAQKPEREEAVMACLLDRLAPAGEAAPAAEPAEGTLLAAAHLLAVLCDASPAMRLAGVRKGGLS